MILALHALSGAAIANTVGEPALALPLAFFSHFIADRIPHTDYGVPNISAGRKDIRVVADFAASFTDAFLGFAIIILLSGMHPLLIAAAFFAMLPDGLWVIRAIFPKIPFLGFFRAIHHRLHYKGDKKLKRTLPFDIAAFVIFIVLLII